MKTMNINRMLGFLLIGSCIFSNVFPFLNIETGILVLSVGRQVLFLECVICFFLWIDRLRKKQVATRLKGRIVEICVFVFLFFWKRFF